MRSLRAMERACHSPSFRISADDGARTLSGLVGVEREVRHRRRWTRGISELVGRADGLGDGDVGLPGASADRTDEGLELRVAEERHELLSGLPLVDDKDEAVADPESMVQRAGALGALSDLFELAPAICQGLLELRGVSRHLHNGQCAHVPPLEM